MDVSTRRWRYWNVAALVALSVIAGVDAWRLMQIGRWNRAIADGSIVDARGPMPVEAKFAQAYLLEQRGEHQEALARYQELERGTAGDLIAAGKYNSANIYLRWAHEFRAQENASPAMPLLELAKQTYRDLLRTTPENWSARYNLERALRLSAESDEANASDLPPPPQSERAITTMRGFTLGLP